MWHVFRKIFSPKQFRTESVDLNDVAITLQYPAIKDEWRKITSKNYEKALRDYPSKHLLGNDEKWHKMLDKQWDCAKHLDSISWSEFKTRYNFSEEDWKKIKDKLLLDLLKGK